MMHKKMCYKILSLIIKSKIHDSSLSFKVSNNKKNIRRKIIIMILSGYSELDFIWIIGSFGRILQLSY